MAIHSMKQPEPTENILCILLFRWAPFFENDFESIPHTLYSLNTAQNVCWSAAEKTQLGIRETFWETFLSV